MIEPWLRQHLERVGLWNSDRVTRKAASARCRGCGRMLLVGLDGDRCAMPAAVDPGPLSAQGEMIAQLLDLRTYSLRWAIDYLELNLRNQWSIALHPAGSPERPGALPPYDVVAEHSCAVQALPSAPSVFRRPRITDYSGDPPF